MQHSAAMTRLSGSRKEEFERIRRHHEAFTPGAWNVDGLAPEARACMILNRFSRNLGVMYASPSCEMILHVDPESIIGKPLLLFIRADDLGTFVEQADIAKTSTVVTHMRFWFQSPNCQGEIPIEAMLFGCADGMVAILRRCRPFVRKQMIGSMEQFENSLNGASPMSSSLGSSTSGGGSNSSQTRSSYGSSPASSIDSSPRIAHVPNIESRSSGSNGFRIPRAGMRSVATGSIENIQNLERDQSRFRPLAPLVLSDQTFRPIPKVYQFREVVQIDSDEEEDGEDEEEDESVLHESDDDESNYFEEEDMYDNDVQLQFGGGENDDNDGDDDYGHGDMYERLGDFGVVPRSPIA
ncbi:MAG: hypothetical protein J3R72DRAFT_435673 [Linnemannia gamsii]|nr:MAG: hypothetical protein J3R72DRAFT_435673 [Linnemannia gamsii]